MIDIVKHFVLSNGCVNGNNLQFADIEFGDRLLDIGTGPTTYTILGASRYVKQIDLSDFTPKNLKILREWQGEKRALVRDFVEYDMDLAGDR